jgi:replicative DNA helicase
MKLFDSMVELQLVRTICDTDQKALIFSKITTEYFGYTPALEVFNRIVVFLHSGKQVPTSEILKNDLALSEEARAGISNPVFRPFLGEADIETACAILAKYRKARIILTAATNAVEILKQKDPDVDGVVSEMESILQKCHSGLAKNEMMHYSKVNLESLKSEINKDLDRVDTDCIPTGFGKFDRETGGFRRKQVIAMASTPGGGKSAMALQMMISQYLMGFNVCLVSYEMDELEIRYRLLSNCSLVNHRDINLKRLSARQRQIINERFDELITGTHGNNRLTIWTPERELNVPEIALELKPYGYDVIYIDYLSLLKQAPGKQLWEVLGDHARAAKLAANNLNAAMVVLAQYDDQENKIKYSKAIIANSNFVWAWEHGQKEKESGIIEVKQLKARGADTYSFYLQKDFKVFKFMDYFGPSPEEIAKKTSELPKMQQLSTLS